MTCADCGEPIRYDRVFTQWVDAAGYAGCSRASARIGYRRLHWPVA